MYDKVNMSKEVKGKKTKTLRAEEDPCDWAQTKWPKSGEKLTSEAFRITGDPTPASSTPGSLPYSGRSVAPCGVSTVRQHSCRQLATPTLLLSGGWGWVGKSQAERRRPTVSYSSSTVLNCWK